MQTLDDARRAARLGDERKQLIDIANNIRVTADRLYFTGETTITPAAGAYSVALKVEVLADEFRALVTKELEAQVAKIDEELRALGIGPGLVELAPLEAEAADVPKVILIVDDDPAQRLFLEETIRRLGHETRTAPGGEQALQILEGPHRASIGLVLLDQVMPGTDGMEVLRRVASKPATPPIIMQTAHGSIDAAINAMRAGAVDFVVKPTSPDRLEVSINSALKIEALQGEIARIKRTR
jgi:CheY-like chemotaxis protein